MELREAYTGSRELRDREEWDTNYTGRRELRDR
jgi:hypothetical protein